LVVGSTLNLTGNVQRSAFSVHRSAFSVNALRDQAESRQTSLLEVNSGLNLLNPKP